MTTKSFQIVLALTLAVLTSSGCGPALKAGKSLLKGSKAAKHIFKAKKLIPPKVPKSSAKQFSKIPIVLSSKVISPKVQKMVLESEKIGAKLFATKSKIPVNVYARIFLEWSRNNDRLKQIQGELKDESLVPSRVQILEQEAQRLLERNREIKSKSEEYG